MKTRGGPIKSTGLAGGPTHLKKRGGLVDGAGPAGAAERSVEKPGSYKEVVRLSHRLPAAPWKSLRLSHRPLENSRPATGLPGVFHTAHSPCGYGCVLSKIKRRHRREDPSTGSGPLLGTRSGTRRLQNERKEASI